VAELSTRANFLWALIGRVVYGLSQWGTIVALAKFGTVETVGVFSLALSVTAPPTTFLNLNLRNLYATDIEDRFAFASYQRLRYGTALGGLAICFGLAAGFGRTSAAVLAIALMGGAKAVETLLDFRYGIYQRFGRMDRYGQSLIVRGSFGTITLAVAMWATANLPVALLAMGGVWVVVLLALDVPRSRTIYQARASGPRGWSWPEVTSIGRLAFPLGVVALIDSFTQNLPRYLVEYYGGAQALGLYAPMTYVVVVGAAFTFAVGAPLAPRLAAFHVARDRRGFTRLSVRLIVLGAVMGVAGVVFAIALGEPFLALAYGPIFAEHDHVFVWIMVSGGLQYVMVLAMYPLTVARRLRIQALVFVAVALVTLGFGMRWVPGLGLLGAAYASVCGFAVGSVLALAANVFAVLSIPAKR